MLLHKGQSIGFSQAQLFTLAETFGKTERRQEKGGGRRGRGETNEMELRYV